MGRASEAAAEYFRCVREHDADGITALFAPDAVVVLPSGAALRGTEQIRSFYEDVAFANGVVPRPLPPIEHGDRCAVELATGDDDGPNVVDVFTVGEDDRVTNLRIYSRT